MKPDRRFINQKKDFWANVRLISQQVGYTQRGKAQIKVPTLSEVQRAFNKLPLDISHLFDEKNRPTNFGALIFDYFQYRADILNNFVERRLMNLKQAEQRFKKLRRDLSPKCPIPMNKQKGEKRKPAFFTGIINMLIEANSNGFPCDYSPGVLTTMTRNGRPLRTLARRIDGAFPNAVNPIAIWEVKEYYFTTTFGSGIGVGPS
jgi:hypothetical protein